MMVVEEVTEALAADYEAQVTIAARNSRGFRQGLDQSDDATAALFEDRPATLGCDEETAFFTESQLEYLTTRDQPLAIRKMLKTAKLMPRTLRSVTGSCKKRIPRIAPPTMNIP